MMLLFVENSDLAQGDKDRIRQCVIDQLKRSRQGGRVDRAYAQTLGVTNVACVRKLGNLSTHR
jgi:hypothetical protein